MEDAGKDGSQPVLKADGVTKRYGKFVALEGVSLEVNKGRHLLILGPNGAGKTTLIRCVLSLASFDGKITVGGIDVRRDPTKIKSMIGYVPQNYAFYENLTVEEQARMSSRLKRVDPTQAKEKLEKVDLWNVKNRKIRALSDGMKQRLGIALALISDPPLLILDEPTSNIDLKGQLDFQDLLMRLLREGKTVLTTTHLTGIGELASEVLVLDKGKRIAFGEPSALLGKVNVADTFYVRTEEPNLKDLRGLIEKHLGDSISMKGNWLTASIPADVKMPLIRDLIESGIEIQDIMIERSSIESEYLRLLGGERSN